MDPSPLGGAGTARRAAGGRTEGPADLRVRVMRGLGEISPVWCPRTKAYQLGMLAKSL